jgi:dolichol kinase
MALALTIIEIVSTGGLDNLTVPLLAAFFILIINELPG